MATRSSWLTMLTALTTRTLG
uniref:Uncharacterized protein n=1 Tax=Macrostomum lignano TaxID=282301 RepID=A0A1I8HKW6_9PLAT